MVQPAIKEKILKDLDRLPAKLQQKVQEFAHALVLTEPKGTPGKVLLRFAGVLDEDSTPQMEKAIEDGCEQVDLDQW